MWFNAPTGRVDKAILTSISEKISARILEQLLSTVPTNKLRAELAIRALYKIVEQPEPERIIWFASPFAALVAIASVLKSKPIPTKLTPPDTLEYTREINDYLRDTNFYDAFAKAKAECGQQFDRTIAELCNDGLSKLVREYDYKRDPDLPNLTAIKSQMLAVWQARLEPGLPRAIAMSIPRHLMKQRIDFDCAESRTLMVEIRRKLPHDSNVGSLIDWQTYWQWHHSVRQSGGIVMQPVVELLRSELSRVLIETARNPVRSLLSESVELYKEIVSKLATYEFAQIGRRKVPDYLDMKGLFELGWMFPFRNVAIAVERPKVLNLDSHNRPHADFGNAIEYNDGWTCWLWHGVAVRIPETDMDWRPSELIPEDYYGL